MKGIQTLQTKRFYSSLQSQKIKLPGILTDIDGVVYRGGHEIGNSRFVIKTIFNHKFNNKYIPFALLTNGGGIPENERAEYVNHVINLDNEPQGTRIIEGKDMILCHTPFKSENLLQENENKYVLVSGLGDMIKIAKNYGYKKAIDIEELMGLYPLLHPERRSDHQASYYAQRKQQVLERLNISEDQLKKELKFDAIFLWSDAIKLEANIQIFSDLLISKDGRLGESIRNKTDPQHVKLYLTNPDLIYADKFKLLRHGQGILINCLKLVFKQTYGMDFQYSQFGKPERVTFDYAEQVLRQKADKQGIEISDFYMIGDNPEGDIEGANRKGWNSILVKTGVHQHLDEFGKENKHEAKFLNIKTGMFGYGERQEDDGQQIKVERSDSSKRIYISNQTRPIGDIITESNFILDKNVSLTGLSDFEYEMDQKNVKWLISTQNFEDRIYSFRENSSEEQKEGEGVKNLKDKNVDYDSDAIKQLPPDLSDVEKFFRQKYFLFSKYDSGLFIDREGWYSITPEPIAAFMAYYMKNLQQSIIIDGCCGVGGNVIQFAMLENNKNCIATELDKDRAKYADYNCKKYKVNQKVDVTQGAFLELKISKYLDKVNPEKQVAFFFDPPWGGLDYKDVESKMKVNDFEPYPFKKTLIKAIEMSPNLMLKLPINMDIDDLIYEISDCYLRYNPRYLKNNGHQLNIQVIKFKQRFGETYSKDKYYTILFGNIVEDSLLRNIDEFLNKHNHKHTEEKHLQFGYILGNGRSGEFQLLSKADSLYVDFFKNDRQCHGREGLWQNLRIIQYFFPGFNLLYNYKPG
ncbi:had-superfamily subfamily iia cecr5 containing protein [Stylonychia lemnae]|uniref:Trimethylguanosine synthase n=1 Tax=Stylonychia lemnae TaxID=5949 RepID=A0A078APT2_STYLE|nr:had-superfamily subfamily iia cecr5 containing protein [Stylonychia lemnae]|eukprot:CDW83976.1 had-superfamily subfamily iia cecr5 containing protein [Stylonychia lemnae]